MIASISPSMSRSDLLGSRAEVSCWRPLGSQGIVPSQVTMAVLSIRKSSVPLMAHSRLASSMTLLSMRNLSGLLKKVHIACEDVAQGNKREASRVYACKGAELARVIENTLRISPERTRPVSSMHHPRRSHRRELAHSLAYRNTGPKCSSRNR